MTALLAEEFPITDLPDHLSGSAINDYLTCPMRWAGTRLLGFPRIPASAPLAGVALHAAVEIHHRYEDHDPETELVQRWKAVRPVIQAERALGKPIMVDLARSLTALDLYRERFPFQPYDGAEEFFSVTIPGVPVPIIGYMDLVTSDNLICDVKTTGSNSWTPEKADTELQATLYAYAFHQMTGELPQGFEYRVLYTGTRKPVDLTVLPTQRTAKHFEALEILVRDVYAHMQTEPLRQTCPRGWCSTPDACAAHVAKQRLLTGEPEPEAKPKREKVAAPQLRVKPPVSLFDGRSVLAALGGTDD